VSILLDYSNPAILRISAIDSSKLDCSCTDGDVFGRTGVALAVAAAIAGVIAGFDAGSDAGVALVSASQFELVRLVYFLFQLVFEISYLTSCPVLLDLEDFSYYL
jgi:methylaspartate ammonia-lyase